MTASPQPEVQPTLPQGSPAEERSTVVATESHRGLAHRLQGRARFLALAASQPALRGAPMALGPRVRITTTAQTRFERGHRCAIAGDFVGHFGGHVTWGDDVFVNVGAYFSSMESLVIGNRCRFGERVSIHDEDHVFEPLGADRSGYATSPVVIEDDVWIGAGAIVLRGTRLGRGSVVAAGSVVRGQFGPGQLLAGVPARAVRALRSSEDRHIH